MSNVPARMVFIPQRITNRKNVTEPRLDMLFSFPDLYEGAKVILVVYHLDIYWKTGLCHQEGTKFHKFKQGDLTRAFLDDVKKDERGATELHPKMGNSTGILLKLEGTLLRSSKVKSPRGWWFGLTGTPEENTSKPFSIARFHLATTQEDAIASRVNSKAIARIIILNDTFQNAYTDHRLAFRMALTSDHAGIKKGAVIAASLCPEHNPAVPPEPKSNPKDSGVILFDEAGIKQGKPHPIGGDGESSSAVPPTPNPRLKTFDLTGQYEHVNPGKDPALSLHLNQVGYSLVGWFSFPIPVPSPTPPGVIPGLPAAPGCIWVSSLEAEDKARGYQFFWATQSTNTTNQMDPDAIVPQANGSPGWIKQTKHPTDPNGEAVELTFEHNDGSSSAGLVLRKIQDGARWPWVIINDPNLLSPDERDLVIADQVRPVTQVVWDRLEKAMSPKTELEKGPPQITIESVITEWVKAPHGSARDGPRIKLANHLDHLMNPFVGFSGDYAHRAALRIKAAAAAYSVTVGAAIDSVYGWFQQIVSQYMTDLAEKRAAGFAGFKDKTDADLLQSLESGFRRAEFGPEGKFIYTMTFSKMLQSPDAIPMVRGYWFTVKINKFVQNKDGSRTPDTAWSNHGWEKKDLHGVFFVAGVGVSTKGKTKAGSLPSKAECSSFSSLTFSDFDGASFSVVGLSGPAITGMPSVKTHESSMLQFTLKNGVNLTSFQEENLSASPGKPSIPPKRPGFSLFGISGGGGTLTSKIPVAESPPSDTSDDIAKEKDTKAAVFVLFARDSASIEQRNYFERRLAMYRASFQTGSPKTRVLGYASPEASAAHNLDLTKRRATAVKTAVLDALHPDMAPTTFDVVGLGEEPSIKKGGLLDPPGKTDAEKKRIHEEALTKYAVWRAVDVWVQGTLLVRTKPKEEQKGKP